VSLYADSQFPVAPEVEALHQDELASFSRPGTWWNAAERTAIAAEARKLRCAAGVQESIGDEALAEAAALAEPVRRVIGKVALGGADVDREFVEQAIADGLGEEAYVEAIGICARIAHLDVFARGIGVPSRRLAEPAGEHPPARERPEAAMDEGFFTASVPSGRRGGELAKSLYGEGIAPNILRSLSLVPDEARRLIGIMETEYLTPEQIMDFGYSGFDDLARPQLELVAARVSALNQCFY